MKALSIKQPWAHLLASGIKDVENRSRRTHYRGKLLIHASGTIDSRFRAMNMLFTPEQWAALSTEEQRKAAAGIYPMSAIIGEMEVVDCVRGHKSVWAEPGQWHWVVKDAVLYEAPILNVKGKLSLWEFDKQ